MIVNFGLLYMFLGIIMDDNNCTNNATDDVNIENDSMNAISSSDDFWQSTTTTNKTTTNNAQYNAIFAQSINFMPPSNNNFKNDQKPSISNPLPNDNCKATKDAELKFLSNYKIQPYKYRHDELSSVIYSRVLKERYYWPLDEPLTANVLSKLQTTGHTLGIDNTRSYFRMLNFDIDCNCRRDPNAVMHLNMSAIVDICKALAKILEPKNFKADRYHTSIWRNNCGFHIYTNIGVSLPTHMHLWRALKAQFQSAETFIIEVPSIMPLPYSAKVTGKCYEPTSENKPIYYSNCHQTLFMEMFEYGSVLQGSGSVLEIDTIGRKVYVSRRDNSTTSQCTPRFFNVTNVNILDNSHHMEQMREYVQSMIMQYAIDLQVLGSVDFSNTDVDVKNRFIQFINLIMTKFNSEIIRQSDRAVKNIAMTDDNAKLMSEMMNKNNNGKNGFEINEAQANACNLFVFLSTIRYGCLYLEPFAAALCIYMKMNIDQRFEDFRSLLKTIYANVMDKTKVINVFIERINLESIIAYRHTAIDILDCLAYYINYNVDPTANIVDQVDMLMSLKLNATAKSTKNDLQYKLKGGDKQQCIDRIVNTYQDIVREMRLTTFNNNSTQYYTIHPDAGRSFTSRAHFFLPAIDVLGRWLTAPPCNSNQNGSLFKGISELNNIKMLSPFREFDDNSNSIATQLGTFNYITGLYTANTWLMNFKKYRHSVLYNYCDASPVGVRQMSLTLNESIVDYTDRSLRMLKKLEDTTTELYMHSIIVPALLQLRYITSIDGDDLSEFFNCIGSHSSFESVYFIVEYYPIDPKFIYLIMYFYDSMEVIVSYHKLVRQLFKYATPNAQMWYDEFHEIYDECLFDNSLPTHMEKLCSIKGPSICNSIDDNSSFSPDTMLVSTIIAVCMLKSTSFSPLIEAFKVTMPEKFQLTRSEYNNFNTDTSTEAMSSNIERARNMIYGQLDRFENDLLTEYISLCISTCFDKQRVSNLIDTVAISFQTCNVLKKFIVYHGASNVGKSYLCTKLQDLLGPQVGRFREFSLAFKRAETTGENVVTILNEVRTIDANELKSVTGNDPESASKFYSQLYEMQMSQSLLYGATNVHIEFVTKGNMRTNNVDITSIQRIYSIMLTGSLVQDQKRESSLFSMLMESRYYQDIIKIDIKHAAQAMGWLAFASYLNKRDKNGKPFLDESSPENLEYQNMVFYNNNRLYRCMTDAGITRAENFFMYASELLGLIEPSLDRTLGTNEIKSLSEFRKNFNHHYNIKLEDPDEKVYNFQQTNVVSHIKKYFGIIKIEGKSITRTELINRIKSIFTLQSHRQNAERYFTSTYNSYFNKNTMTFENIAFNCDASSFNGNEINIETSVNPDSLVLRQV